MTAENVAEETQLARSTIWRIENGHNVRTDCLLSLLVWMEKTS